MLKFFKKSSFDLVFRVTLHIHEISNLTLHSGRVYVSWKVKGFGNASGSTKRQKIGKNKSAPGFLVVFDEKFTFDVDMNANSKTMLLEDTITKLGVYHENTSGRAYQRLGKIHVNLSEYAGTTSVKKRAYLLEDSRMNGTVIVGIKLERIKGFPTFRVPTSTDNSLAISGHESNAFDTLGEELDSDTFGTPAKMLSVEVVNGKRFLMSPIAANKSKPTKTQDISEESTGKKELALDTNTKTASQSEESVGFPSTPLGTTPTVKRKARTHIRTASGPFYGKASAAITASRNRFDVDGVVDDILDAKSPIGSSPVAHPDRRNSYSRDEESFDSKEEFSPTPHRHKLPPGKRREVKGEAGDIDSFLNDLLDE